MFLGEFEHNLDSKNRIIVPAKFRENLGDVFYITRGLESCLWVFSKVEWDKIVAKFDNMPMVESRKVQRYFFSGAVELSPDSQGRILLPPMLLKHAKIEKSVTFLGVNTKIEIWNTDILNDNRENDDNIDLEETMTNLGL